MKALLVGFPCSALLAYLLCALAGVTAQPVPGPSVTAEEAAAALAFSFSDADPEPGSWHIPSGTASHGWLFRRAYVQGHLGSVSGTFYSEQVLKVGWPFTVVRGFVRRVGPQTTQEGALVIGAAQMATSRRILPTQPVWPGVVFYGLVGIVIHTAIPRRFRLTPGRPAGMQGR